MTRTVLVIAIAVAGCRRKTPEAPPEFSDAIVNLFVSFDAPDDELAEATRIVEEQIYLGMDVEASSPTDRALSPARLTEADVAGLEHPEERNVVDALPICVGGLSAFDVDTNSQIQLLTDHTVVEPYSPDHYVREFLTGQDCWLDRSCLRLETWNDLTKKNILMEVPYNFYKDFRWVDLETDGAGPRWAYVARSWDPESYVGEGGNSWIHQGYTIEVWIPRDGRGYVRSASDQNVDGGTWTGDSHGIGTLRMLGLWSETEFKGLDVSDDQVIATTRAGIDKNFEAADEYLAGL